MMPLSIATSSMCVFTIFPWYYTCLVPIFVIALCWLTLALVAMYVHAGLCVLCLSECYADLSVTVHVLSES